LSEFFKKNIGTVAIAVLPGEDIGSAPTIIVSAFKKAGVAPICFVKVLSYMVSSSIARFNI
jgi:hypothetical protein